MCMVLIEILMPPTINYISKNLVPILILHCSFPLNTTALIIIKVFIMYINHIQLKTMLTI